MAWWEWGVLVAALVALGGKLGTLWWRSKRGGVGDRFIARQAHATQESVVALASREGWQVSRGADAASHPFPTWLASATVDIGECDLVVSGSAGGHSFVAGSWMAFAAQRGSALQAGFRQSAVVVAAPEVDAEIAVGGVPLPYAPHLMPQLWHGRAVPDGGAMILAGDVADTMGQLTPLLREVEAAGVWLATRPGEVAVTGAWEPDARDLQRWLALALAATQLDRGPGHAP